MNVIEELAALARADWRMLVLAVTILFLALAVVGFLVTASILRRRNSRKADRWDRYEAHWGEVLLKVLRGVVPPDALRAEVKRGEELYFVDFLYKVALKTRDPSHRAVLRTLATPYLALLVARVRGGDPERRARAVKTLAELGGRWHQDVLTAALDDPSPLVSMNAARALARIAGASNVRHILSRVDRFSDWNARFLRATLAQLGPAAIPSLRESLTDPALSAAIRSVCAEVLGDLGDAEAVRLARGVIQEEAHTDLRAACLRLIRRSGDAASAPLVRSLCADHDPAVRAQAVGALARIGTDADLALLEEALGDDSPWVALHAARGLKERGYSGSLERFSSERKKEGAHHAVALQVLVED